MLKWKNPLSRAFLLGYFPRESKHFSRNLSIASGGIGAVIMEW